MGHTITFLLDRELAFECSEQLPRLAQLAKAYTDREPDLAGPCPIRMSELHPRHSVITVDREDFRVCRRNKHLRARRARP